MFVAKMFPQSHCASLETVGLRLHLAAFLLCVIQKIKHYEQQVLFLSLSKAQCIASFLYIQRSSIQKET